VNEERNLRTALRLDPGFKEAREVLNATEIGLASE